MNLLSQITKLCWRTSVHRNVLESCSMLHKKGIHVTRYNRDLMEFFDDKKNWTEMEVKVGRAWRLDELRIKSNTDLHKLWFVLLKERNMLYTMEKECNEQYKVFPNPERIDKVQISMDNVETVVKERNKAYYELETGETGERQVVVAKNPLGLDFTYEKKEYAMPNYMNTKWVKPYLENGIIQSRAVRKFLKLQKEQTYNEQRKQRNRDFNQVQLLLKKFPDIDIEALKLKYPEVNIEKAKHTKKSRGHFVPKY